MRSRSGIFAVLGLVASALTCLSSLGPASAVDTEVAVTLSNVSSATTGVAGHVSAIASSADVTWTWTTDRPDCRLEDEHTSALTFLCPVTRTGVLTVTATAVAADGHTGAASAQIALAAPGHPEVRWSGPPRAVAGTESALSAEFLANGAVEPLAAIMWIEESIDNRVSWRAVSSPQVAYDGHITITVSPNSDAWYRLMIQDYGRANRLLHFMAVDDPDMIGAVKSTQLWLETHGKTDYFWAAFYRYEFEDGSWPPLADHRVYFEYRKDLSSPWTVRETLVTTREGRVKASATAVAGRYRFRVPAGDGLQESSTDEFVMDPWSHVSVALRLRGRSAVFSGRVTDLAGAPIPNPKVELHMVLNRGCWDPIQATSDRSGHYTLTVPRWSGDFFMVFIAAPGKYRNAATPNVHIPRAGAVPGHPPTGCPRPAQT